MKVLKHLALVIIVVAIGFTGYGLQQNRTLTIHEETIEIHNLAPNLKGTKIVQLSDVHFNRSQISVDRLIAATKAAQPDLIFLTGDIIDRNAIISETPLAEFAKRLSRIALTYAVTGNHETSSGQLTEWRKIIGDNGVINLKNETASFQKGDDRLIIMGVEDQTSTNKLALTEEEAKLPQVLLAHRPEHFTDYLTTNALAQPDITFSGHAHGGQIRVPLLGGLFAPGQGLLPHYTSGVYLNKTNASKKLIVSRGIGNSAFPLRINNQPEVIVVTLN